MRPVARNLDSGYSHTAPSSRACGRHGGTVFSQHAEFHPALLMSLGVGPTKQWNQHTLVHGGQEVNVY